VIFSFELEPVLSQVFDTLNLNSPLLVISKSLAGSPDGKRYVEFLSSKLAGIKHGVGQNSPIEDAIEIAEQIRQTK
jgi:hypothetical protein